MPEKNREIESILKKYGRRMSEAQQDYSSNEPPAEYSQEFLKFKSDMAPQFSRYERWCSNLGSIFKLKVAAKDSEKLQKELSTAHLSATPSQVAGLALIMALAVFLGGLMIFAAIYFITLKFSFLLLILFIFLACFLFYYFYSEPSRLANQWRLRAGSQMVPCILYTVVYMKHTSNLERAIEFASQHIEAPLSLDLKKVFWDVETGKYSTMKESLDSYLEVWRNTNPEFVESFNLIESSLYEPSELRRVQVLERSLQVILDGVYDNMLKYSHFVKAPLTNLYMLGIVLPTLGLALIPLASALMNGAIRWHHVFLIFNVLIPFVVFYMTSQIMMKRPGGYGESQILELNPFYSKFKSKKPYFKALMISLPVLIIGLIPYLMRYLPVSDWFGIQSDYTFAELGLVFLGNMKIFDFVEGGDGPIGILALLFSLFIPLSIMLFFNIAYSGKTKEIITSRNYSKILEGEFNNSLFKLGNRIGDGTPAELAFGRVAESSRGLVTENFFKTVNANIQSLGMSLERAIFDPRRGALIYYPSNLIATSMHILIESVKKGLQAAAQSLMSISEYVRNINKINDRLRDLLAEVVSDMRSNMTFLAPLLAGVVIGLASMITMILSKLSAIMETAAAGGAAASSFGNIGSLTTLFKVETMIPPYILQICIGIYIIEIIFILTKTLVTVDSGPDQIKETYEIAKNLIRGGLLYLIVSLCAIIGLSLIAAVALGGLAG